MIYFIGLGLGNESSITLKGIEAIKSSDLVYLENYTSKLQCSAKDLEKSYNKKIIIASRDLIENSDEILNNARTKTVSLLIIGDVFTATTHFELIKECKKLKIPFKIINNASIFTAIGITGLSLYNFGKPTSIPFENKNIKTPIEVINQNLKNNLHTLILLDLDPINNKFMTVDQAILYLKNKIKINLIIGCAALGSDKQEIKIGNLSTKFNFKNYPQCLIIPSKLNFKEKEFLEIWK